MSGNSEIALQLIEKGAAIHFANGDGWTALHAASYQGKEDVVKVLIEKGAVVNLMRQLRRYSSFTCKQTGKNLSCLAFAGKFSKGVVSSP
jgi:ankyrin repeat protein